MDQPTTERKVAMTTYTAVEVCRTYGGRETFVEKPVSVTERRFEFESSSEAWELINEAEILCSAGTHNVCGETIHTEIRAVLKGEEVVAGRL